MPDTSLAQTSIRDLFAGQPGVDRLTARLVRAAFDGAAIDRRATVITELAEFDGERDAVASAREAGAVGRAHADPAAEADRVFVDADGRVLTPTTGVRNEVYRREAPALFAAAAVDALARAGMAAADVTHVITVSCTGFFAPGPDFLLVRDLGIPATAERMHLGFMGCAAAIPALRAATHICAAQPNAVVLVVCAELCSLHLRASADADQIVAAAVFADGAAAAVVSARTTRAPRPTLEMEAFSTAITSEGESDMDWSIGDQGFRMVLTAEVPRIVGREVRAAVTATLGAEPRGEGGTPDVAPGINEVAAWAIHPGGRAVLDRVQSGLELDDSAMARSRDVLREHGNMSSATVLFILQRILDDDALPDGAAVVALGFGPGLTVESARLVRRTAPA